MSNPPIKATPCNSSNYLGQYAPAEPLALAMDLCEERGVRLTSLRRSRPVAPPTVYRTLEFLMAQGFVSRIESRNAYVPCAHPEHRHDGLFFICGDCGASVELEDPRVGRRLAEDVADLGFRVTRRVVEVQGICTSCLAADVA